jgi:hypothetical protein
MAVDVSLETGRTVEPCCDFLVVLGEWSLSVGDVRASTLGTLCEDAERWRFDGVPLAVAGHGFEAAVQTQRRPRGRFTHCPIEFVASGASRVSRVPIPGRHRFGSGVVS